MRVCHSFLLSLVGYTLIVSCGSKEESSRISHDVNIYVHVIHHYENDSTSVVCHQLDAARDAANRAHAVAAQQQPAFKGMPARTNTLPHMNNKDNPLSPYIKKYSNGRWNLSNSAISKALFGRVIPGFTIYKKNGVPKTITEVWNQYGTKGGVNAGRSGGLAKANPYPQKIAAIEHNFRDQYLKFTHAFYNSTGVRFGNSTGTPGNTGNYVGNVINNTFGTRGNNYLSKAYGTVEIPPLGDQGNATVRRNLGSNNVYNMYEYTGAERVSRGRAGYATQLNHNGRRYKYEEGDTYSVQIPYTGDRVLIRVTNKKGEDKGYFVADKSELFRGDSYGRVQAELGNAWLNNRRGIPEAAETSLNYLNAYVAAYLNGEAGNYNMNTNAMNPVIP